MQNLYKDLENLLKSYTEFIVGGKLNKSKISDAAYQYSETLLKALLGNSSLKKQFFMEVGGATIFKQREFLNFLKNKDFLANSYTEFKNQIGLQDERGEYYRENKDVVLVFPYKDCVLEGGQDKEDQKRNEIFYNETLAPDEITRLFDTKALTNFKLYDKEGEHILNTKTDIDFSKQNLIIKGNNLLALHSLKEIKGIAGQVKLIYIDPPYNTGNDSFHYNDKFNHSTWLVFMKNRLEVAKKLLSNDGTICISIDLKELGYLQILLDETFGIQNRKNLITIKRSSVSGAKVINPGVVNVSEYVVIYSKNTNLWKPNRVLRGKERDERYNSYITNFEEEPAKWEFCSVLDAWAVSLGIEKSKLKKYFKDSYNDKLEEFCLTNAKKIFQFVTLDDNAVSDEVVKLKNKSIGNSKEVFILKREDKLNYYIFNGKAMLFLINRLTTIDGKKVFGELLTDMWDDVLPNDLHNEGGISLKEGKKAEKLLQRILQLTTNENDLVLDFYAGSGTAGAVAHKMNRRYILIEQMDYIHELPETRLKNVIKGEQSGISKAVNWKGGGSFVYVELQRYNQYYSDEIEKAEDSKRLRTLYESIKNDEGFFRIEIDHSKWDNGEFEKLSLEEQKEILCKCLDKNHLYVNLTEMEDAYFKMSKDDIALNKKFYGV